ncbi:MAG: DUF58 domain-containing protein [Spirochaetaceae bacterium]|jgi:uncharacterized protein (DUF58 family)|nr:DUF58 domain-containing protein [Spirochaetaceae bacterium]
MTQEELFSRIRAIRLASSDPLFHLLSASGRGERASFQKGQGLEFDQVRLYEAGDDVRLIDQNVSARFGRPYIKVYREERDTNLFIILDASESVFTAGETSVYEQELLALATLAFSAEKERIALGALFFSSEIVRVFPPKLGSLHIMKIIGAALDLQKAGNRPAAKGDNGSILGEALSRSRLLLKDSSQVVILSDFYSLGWENELIKLGINHESRAIRVKSSIKGRQFLKIRDRETGKTAFFRPKSKNFQKKWADWEADHAAYWEKVCKKAGTKGCEMPAGCNTVQTMQAFYQSGGSR